MDIRLPDGTILRGVPEGTTKEQIREKLAAKGYDVTKLDAPKPQQDAMVPADQRQSGYKATLATAPEPPKQNTAAGVVDAATRGIAPYALAAGAGAGAGSVVPGVGTLAGAGAGVTALAATDLAAFGWNNTAAQWFGAPQMMGGSDALRAATDTVGVTKPLADDPNARVMYDIFNTAGSSIGAGNLVNMGGQLLRNAPGPLGAVGNFFSKPMTNASMTAGGAAGGGASSVAAEMGADPLVQTGVGVLGSMLGGQYKSGPVLNPTRGAAADTDALRAIKPATPAPSAAELKARVNASYNEAQTQGIEWNAGTIDAIASRAVEDAVSASNAGGGLSRAAVSPAITNVLRGMSDLAQRQGRLNAQDIETFRQQLGSEAQRLGGVESKAAARVIEAFDALTNDPARTINALRGNVASARAAAQQAEAAAAAARGAPQEAAARQAADAARVRLEQSQTAMRANDPDMQEVVRASRTRADASRTAEMKAMDADGSYQRAANEQMELEQAAADAEAAYQATAAKFAGRPDAKLQTSKALNKFTAATNIANAGTAKVDMARDAADRARDALDRAQRARDGADRRLQDREASLATVDDAAQRMNARVSAQGEGRRTFPTQVRTAEFEAMPEAARNAAGDAGDTARQLRNQVKAFIRRGDGYEFNQLPAETQRQLKKFASGGGVTQRVLDVFGILAPGSSPRNAAGSFLALASAATAGPGSNFMIPLAQVGVGLGARAGGNAMAQAQFNKLRDMVARGDAVAPRQPGQAGNRAVNYMLTEQIARGQ